MDTLNSSYIRLENLGVASYIWYICIAKIVSEDWRLIWRPSEEPMNKNNDKIVFNCGFTGDLSKKSLFLSSVK